MRPLLRRATYRSSHRFRLGCSQLSWVLGRGNDGPLRFPRRLRHHDDRPLLDESAGVALLRGLDATSIQHGKERRRNVHEMTLLLDRVGEEAASFAQIPSEDGLNRAKSLGKEVWTQMTLLDDPPLNQVNQKRQQRSGGQWLGHSALVKLCETTLSQMPLMGIGSTEEEAATNGSADASLKESKALSPSTTPLIGAASLKPNESDDQNRVRLTRLAF